MCNTSRRSALTLVELIVVLAIIAVLVGLLIPAVQRVRAAALHTQSANNVRQLNLAMLGYADTYRSFPLIDGRNPLTRKQEYSFFVALLPHLEQNNAYAAVMKKVAAGGSVSGEFLTSTFVSPLDPTAPSTGASYAANGSVFDRAVSPFTITDGTSNTVGLAEHYSYDCGGTVFSWVLQRKVVVDVPGALVLRRPTFADQQMGDVVPATQGKTTVGSSPGFTFQVAPNIALCDPRVAQANSGAGLLVGMIDGSVRTLTPSVSERTYWGLITENGGETLGDW